MTIKGFLGTNRIFFLLFLVFVCLYNTSLYSQSDSDSDGITDNDECLLSGPSGGAETPYANVLQVFTFPSGTNLGGSNPSSTTSSVTIPGATGTVTATVTLLSGPEIESANTDSGRPSGSFLGIANNGSSTHDGFRQLNSGSGSSVDYTLEYEFDKPIDVYFFDAETSVSGENLTVTTTGGAIKIVDSKNLSFTNITGLNTTTVTVSPTNTITANAPSILFVSEATTKITLTTDQNSNGRTGIGVGTFDFVCLDTDDDDVPNNLDTDSDADGCPDLNEGLAKSRVSDLEITGQPTATNNVLIDTSVTLNVTAQVPSGGSGTVSYQWQESSTSGGTFTNVSSGGTSASYSPPTNVAGTKYYQALVTNSGTGCGPITSGESSVTVTAPEISIAANSANKVEGDSGNTAFTFTVTRTGDTSGASSATYTVTGSGTNVANADDFGGSFPSGTVSFSSGETSKTVTINVSGDSDDESDEGFTVTLSNPTGTTITTSSDTGTIQNDDTSFSIDTDGDGVTNDSDLDDDNDGILDSDECTFNSVKFPGGSLTQGSGNTVDVIEDLNSQALPTTITINAPTPIGSATDTEIDSQNSGQRIRFKDNNGYNINEGATSVFSFTNPTTVAFAADNTLGSSAINQQDKFVFVAPAGVTWIVISSGDATITNSGNTITIEGGPTSGTGSQTPHAEFSIRTSTSVSSITISHIHRVSKASGVNSGRFNMSICDNTDVSGNEDYLSGDSDGDGCSDADEAYQNINADIDNNGKYGSGTPTLVGGTVNSNGLVIAAGLNGIGDAYTTSPNSAFQQSVDITSNVAPSNATKTVGNTHTFSASATLTAGTTIPATTNTSLSYQWQLDSGSGFSDVSGASGSTTSGTTVQYTTPTLGLSNNGDKYRVIFTPPSNVCDVLTSSSATLTVSTLAPTITFGDIVKTYGDADFTLGATSNSGGTITYSIVGAANGTSLSGTNDEDVSLGNVATVTIRASVAANGSYSSGTKDATLTINKAALTATADDKSKTYGAANPTLTIGYSGFVNGDDASDLDSAPSASTTATTSSNTGTYDITVSGGSDSNYTITETKGTLTINKAALTATADDKSKTYGAANPTLTIGYSGFVNGDDASDLDSAPSASTTATTSSNTGTYDITVSGGSDSNYTITETKGTLTINKAALTATADDKSKTYGAANPTLTIGYSGFVNGDDASDLDSAPSASTTATTSSNAGTYDITVSGGSDSNYTITETKGTLTINKAALTATADDKSKTYGAANPALTIGYSGFVNGDDASDLDSAPSASTTATTSSNAGTYDITVSGGSDSNYTITETKGTLTISKAALTATADDKSKTYGAANPTLTIGYSGFVNGDDASDLDSAPSASTTATTSSNAGTYDITVSGGSDSNYTITETKGTLTINKAALTATADDKSKTYGAANPTLTIGYSGFVNGDDASDLDSAPSASTTATTSSNAGTYDITVSGGSDSNYTITETKGTLTINKAALTATADDKSKTYGAANPTLTIGYSGFVNGDDASDLDSAPSASTTATTSSNAGTYDITVSGGSDSNYTITETKGTLTINKAALTATADDKSKTYGAANPTLTIGYSGFVNGDDASDLDSAPSASTTATTSSNTGTYDITVSGGSDSNYTITETKGTLTINKAALTATADDKSKTYGAANPTLTIGYSGFVNGDDASDLDSAPSASTTATTSSNAGTYDITVSGGSDSNYTITETKGTLTINKAALTATADDKSKTYGAANPTLTIGYSGFVNGDDASDLDSAPSASTTATTSSNAGTYDITVSGGSDSNYTITETKGTLTINKAALTATADDKSKTYGAANPTLTIGYSGFVNGDDASDLDSAPSASTTATTSSNAGTYDITVSGGSDSNYTITETKGTLTINKAALTATADDKSKTYGAANPTLTIGYSGFVNGDDASDLDSAPSASTTATTSSNAGTYDITVSGGSDSNYTITETKGTLTINKAALTATADDKSKTYGAANPTLTIGYSGFVNGDDASDLDSAPSASTTATTSSNTGTYDITVSGGSDSNYTITETKGTLTINKAALTATADDKSKTYGAANPTLTIGYSGFVNGDDASDLDSAPSASTTATTSSNAGTYDITVSGGSDSNYTITETKGTLTINKAALTATADDKSKTYGAANPTLTIGYSGFVNGDDASDLDSAPSASTTATTSSNTGTYDITVSGGSDSNYTITETKGTLTINKAALTATADDKSKTYGAANPTLTIGYSGFVNGDDASDLDSAPSASTTATTSSNAGTYDITVSGGSDSNYTITETKGTLTINKAALTATADDKSKTYGAANPTLTIGYSGFVNGDDASDLDSAPSASTTATTSSNAGTYDITVSGGSDSNYTITETKGTLTINKAALTVTADDRTITYGDNANSGNTVQYSGFITGDDKNDLNGSLSFANITQTNVGTYTDVIVPSGLTSTNYDITFIEGDLTITQKAITVTADAKSKTYGDSDPSLTYQVTGLVGSDVLSGSLSRDSGEDVGTYTINQGTLDNSNYAITYTSDDLTITQKAITVTADAKSKTYGDSDPSLTYQVTGLVGSDVLSGSLSRDSGEDVGTYTINQGTLDNSNYAISYTSDDLTITQKAITVTADAKSKTYGDSDPSLTYQVTGLVGSDVLSGSLSRDSGEDVGTYTINQGTLDNSNYAITYTSDDLTITQKAITVTADAKSKTYGDSDPSLTYQVTGLVGSDVLSGSLSRDSGEDVGTYTINQGTLDNSNYAITYTSDDLTITQKAITVTADAKSKTYGDSDPSLTYQVTGLVGSDVLSGSLSRDSGEDVGTYTINQGTLDNSNYAITYTSDDLTITQKAITVTADAKSKTYGDSDPSLTYQVTGLVGSDVLSGSLSRDSGEDVGTYTINQGTLDNSNYAITYTSDDLTITQKAITVTADAKSKTYGDSDPSLTYQVTGLVGSDVLSGSLSRDSGEDVGTYTINQGTLDNSNYAITYTSDDLTITQKAITVTADAKSKTYGDSDPSLTYQVTGLVGSDVLSGSLSRDSGEDVGTYTINQGTLDNSNYAITYTSDDLTITQKAITVTADAKSKTYGDSDPSLTYQVTGLVGSDVLSGSLSRDSGEDVGTYTINQGTLDNSNYAITYTSDDLTITQKAITITADAKSKTYGDSDPSLTYQVTGLVGSDVLSGSLSRDSGEDVGTYTINQGTLDNSNYAITYTSDDLTITQKAITVTADAKSKTYGDSDPSLTYQVTGLVGSDVLSGSLSRDSGEDVGTYTINQGTLDNSNYAITYTSDDLTITQKAITVTADAKSKTYGDSDPSLTYQVTGLVGSDVLSGSLSRDSGEDVGTYTINQGTLDNSNYAITYTSDDLTITQKAITVTADAKSKTYGDSDPSLTYQVTGLVGSDVLSGSLSRDSGEDVGTYTINQGTLDNSNYAITYTSDDLTITQKAITVTADAKSKTYGDSDPSLTYQVTGLVGSDVLSGSLSRDSGEDVGTYTINQGTLDNSNYAITYTSDDLTITQKAITVTADAKSKTYGDSDPSLTYQVTGLVGSDVLSGSLSRDSGEDVGTYTINQGTLDNSNYAITYTSDDLTITQKAITVTADAKSKTYGDSDPSLTYQVTGLVGSDVLSGSLSRDSGEDVGTYTINQGTLDNSNYAITYTSDDLTITQKAITVTADAKSKTYGDSDPSLTYQVTGLVGSDVLSGSLSRDSGEDVGTYTINQGTLDNSNYAITYTSDDLTITQKAITVTADAKSKTYGDSDPSLTYQVTGLVGSDVLSGSLSRDSGEDVGTYTINQGTLDNSNYAITYTSDDLTIGKATLTATADDKTRNYGETNPIFTITYSGFVTGDDASVLDTAPIASTIADSSSKGGDYEITLAGGSGNNYNLVLNKGTLTVVSEIDAVTEMITGINGNIGGTTNSLLDNDILDGDAVVVGTGSGEITLKVVDVPTGLTLNPNGTVTVAPNTPEGTYDVTYQICLAIDATNCDTVTSTIEVEAAVIDAVADTIRGVNGNTGGTTSSLLDNDTLNGNTVVGGTNSGEVIITGITVPSELTLNPDGTVTVAPNTITGDYNITYQICEVTNPSNCDTVTSIISVVGVCDDDPNDDCDGDGVLNKDEAVTVSDWKDPSNDTDGDSTPDYLDTDDDGDGVQTKDENPDVNNDGDVSDAQDTDGDDTPDYLDTDDDGDSVPTKDENPDANKDGDVSDAQDTDGDDTPDYLDTDDDGDGVQTKDENPDVNKDGDVSDAQDTDVDDTPDYLDTDDDGDGVQTKDENPDANNDGDISDAQDTDGDDTPDYLDTDDDGDSVPTKDENPDKNNDGDISDAEDTDVDDIPDYLDTDDDGDGVPTKDENPDKNNDGDISDAQDTDGDDTPDYLDMDDDGDKTDTKDEDANNDGDLTNDDSDGDNTPDYLDRIKANNDQGYTDLVTPLILKVITNDIAVNKDVLALSNSGTTTTTTHGTATFNADNTITYQRTGGVPPTDPLVVFDSFDYEVCDQASGQCSTAKVEIFTPDASEDDFDDLDKYDPIISLIKPDVPGGETPLSGLLEISKALNNDRAVIKQEIGKDDNGEPVYELKDGFVFAFVESGLAKCTQKDSDDNCIELSVDRDETDFSDGTTKTFTNKWIIRDNKIYFDPAQRFIGTPTPIDYQVIGGVGIVGEATISLELLPVIDLEIDIKVSNSTPEVEEIVEFITEIKNNSNDGLGLDIGDANNIRLENIIPNGYRFIGFIVDQLENVTINGNTFLGFYKGNEVRGEFIPNGSSSSNPTRAGRFTVVNRPDAFLNDGSGGTIVWTISKLLSGELLALNYNAEIVKPEYDNTTGELIPRNYDNVVQVTDSDKLDIDSLFSSLTIGSDEITKDTTAADDDEDVEDVELQLTDTALEFVELLTPNGDGSNDGFEIDNLPNVYPNFEMVIFNRYGSEVYRYKHTTGPAGLPDWWDGFSHSGGTEFRSNEQLPVGTYFYILYKHRGTEKPIQGWIYLNR